MEILGRLAYRDWKKGKGVDPHRIVLLKIRKGNRIEYTTHEEVKRPGKKEFEHYSGHYFTNLGDAFKDFFKRGK